MTGRMSTVDRGRARRPARGQARDPPDRHRLRPRRDPVREEPVRRLYRAKGRDEQQPTALVAATVDMLLECVPELRGRVGDDRPRPPARAVHARAAEPGAPLPVAERARARTRSASASPSSTGPGREVLERAGAFAATSANLPGGPDPRTLADVPEELRAAAAARRRRRRAAGRAVDGARLHRPGAARPARGRRSRPRRSSASQRARDPAVRVASVAAETAGRSQRMAVAQQSLEQLRSAGLAEVDPEIADLLGRELERQRGQIELIASENFTWPSVFEAVGSVPTNKYAEGYPGRRYYGGCEVVDEIEQLAIDRAKELFGAEHANVQPHAGRAGEHGRLLRAAAAGRHDPLAPARPRRPPHARAQGQLLRPALHDRPLRRLARDERGRLRRGARAREGAPAEADRLRRLRLSAHGRRGSSSARSPTRSARC